MFSTAGDIIIKVGRYLEYCGGCSVPWEDTTMHVGDIMSTAIIHVGDIMSTVGVFNTVGE